jgi:hypothetical protein
MIYHSRPTHLRGGVTHEDRVAIIRELDSYDPLRLALRRLPDDVALAVMGSLIYEGMPKGDLEVLGDAVLGFEAVTPDE